MFNFLPHSVLQMSAIFLSIVIEAIPFVLLGCIISGALQVFLTPERVRKILPNNKFLAILVGSFLGFFFPSCECGIVPIVTQFIRKGVPEHTAFAFMVTAPIINPIVLFSTYIAFGNSVKFALLRGIGSLIVALIIGSWIAYFNRTPILKTALHDHSHSHHHHDKTKRESFGGNVWSVLVHGIDEFFDTGRYLIIGALIASSMQVYLPTIHDAADFFENRWYFSHADSGFYDVSLLRGGRFCWFLFIKSIWNQCDCGFSSLWTNGGYQELDDDETQLSREIYFAADCFD